MKSDSLFPCRASEAMNGEDHAGGAMEGASFEFGAQLVGHVDVVVAHAPVVLRGRVLRHTDTRTHTHKLN